VNSSTADWGGKKAAAFCSVALHGLDRKRAFLFYA